MAIGQAMYKQNADANPQDGSPQEEGPKDEKVVDIN